MRAFLPESIVTADGSICSKDTETVCLLNKNSTKNKEFLKSLPSLSDSVSLLKSSLTLTQAAVVAFFTTVGDSGLYAGLLYYFKACFHFNKDQFADLMVINGIAGTISQLVIMPIFAPSLGEEKMLSVGLFFCCVHISLYGMAWSSWVPYLAASLNVLAVFAMPCLRSIISKQVGPTEQGKAQGCITGICSFANVISPLAFSPLTAMFLSERAPFRFPGFSIMCAALAIMIAFIQSAMMRPVPATSQWKAINENVGEP